jgi:pimeloyl-ACP methyl ester carboxylesterase
MAGGEITLFASLYPDRVRKLIYLDAAYDLTCSAGRALDPWASKFTQRLDAELKNPRTASDIFVENLPLPAKWEAIKATVKAADSFHPDYSRVDAPAFAVYAPPERYPDAPRGTPAGARIKMDEWWMKNRHDCAAKSIDQFRQGVHQGQVAIIKNGYHYLFLGIAQREVVRLTREFLLQRSVQENSDE